MFTVANSTSRSAQSRVAAACPASRAVPTTVPTSVVLRGAPPSRSMIRWMPAGPKTWPSR